MAERNPHAAADAFLLALAGRTDVDDERRGSSVAHMRSADDLRAEALGGLHSLRSRFDAVEPVFEIADDLVVADPALSVANCQSCRKDA